MASPSLRVDLLVESSGGGFRVFVMALSTLYIESSDSVIAIAPSIVGTEILQTIGSNYEDHHRDRSTIMLCARQR